jgi:hypothetical protein
MPTVTPVHVAPSTQRTAEPSRFDQAMHQAALGAASGLAATVALAAPFAPGGPVLAGALRGAAAGAASPVVSTGGTDLVEATRTLQLQSQSWNVQYLALQESLQRESREFQALSNAMKVKHDAAKAAIGNIH